MTEVKGTITCVFESKKLYDSVLATRQVVTMNDKGKGGSIYTCTCGKCFAHSGPCADIAIDSHIRIPRPKKTVADEERRRKLFRRYSETYQTLNVRRPDRYTFDAASKIMRVFVGKSIADAGSEAILERRIRQMQQRIQDRE